jgi:hypothetical protein
MGRACRVLAGNPEGKRSVRRPRQRRDDKINLSEIGWTDMDWNHLAQDGDQSSVRVNTAMSLPVP